MWQRYLAGDLTFLTGSQIFDQAANLARMLTQRFEAEHPRFKKFDNIVEDLGRQDYITKGPCIHRDCFRLQHNSHAP